MGGGGGNFIEDTIDDTKDAFKDLRANDVYDWASNVAGSAANYSTGGLYGLATGDGWSTDQLGKDTLNAGTAGGVHAHEKAILDPKADALRKAEQEAADAERAMAAGIAALPKNPTVEEIQRQRQRQGGRRGTILTTPGQSLGSTSQGKTLLGL